MKAANCAYCKTEIPYGSDRLIFRPENSKGPEIFDIIIQPVEDDAFLTPGDKPKESDHPPQTIELRKAYQRLQNPASARRVYQSFKAHCRSKVDGGRGLPEHPGNQGIAYSKLEPYIRSGPLLPKIFIVLGGGEYNGRRYHW